MIKRHLCDWVNMIWFVDDTSKYPNWSDDNSDTDAINLLKITQLQKVCDLAIGILESLRGKLRLLLEPVDSMWEQVFIHEEKTLLLGFLVVLLNWQMDLAVGF